MLKTNVGRTECYGQFPPKYAFYLQPQNAKQQILSAICQILTLYQHVSIFRNSVCAMQKVHIIMRLLFLSVQYGALCLLHEAKSPQD